jgi:pimeloyl-ACP methyl ester carboxylesterase
VATAGKVLLIHGGLWEDISANWFWRRTGVIDELEQRGLTVLAPDRLRRAPNWTAEAAHLASAVADAVAGAVNGDEADATGAPWTVVGGSFGCAAALRLALDFPALAGRLLLAWPASAVDQFIQIRLRAGLSRQGASGTVLSALLGGGTLPGTADSELAGLTRPVGVLPAAPPSPLHPRAAVDALLRLLPSATELPGGPEAPRPEFPEHRTAFCDAVAAFAAGG